ncbi:MAG: HigA family addiction module antidote protein [Proteobacteria bacterium]|nr:HigA family addiction module antidote protein [Pseudomonadota bacterium]MCH8262056.1 HigA family addiction module antidote protein [Pseudomonadota bacterium]
MNRQPTHPGAILREDVIPALKDRGVNVTQFTRALRISRSLLYGILDERKPVTPNIAVRLGRVLGNGPVIWLNIQRAYDLWEVEAMLANELNEMPIYKVA